MAIATLEACFDNPRLFTGVVKIRKGLTARLLLDSESLEGVHFWFYELSKGLAARCPADDPSRDKILAACAAIVKITQSRAHAISCRRMGTRAATLVAVGATVGAASVAWGQQ